MEENLGKGSKASSGQRLDTVYKVSSGRNPSSDLFTQIFYVKHQIIICCEAETVKIIICLFDFLSLKIISLYFKESLFILLNYKVIIRRFIRKYSALFYNSDFISK